MSKEIKSKSKIKNLKSKIILKLNKRYESFFILCNLKNQTKEAIKTRINYKINIYRKVYKMLVKITSN